MNSNFVDYVFLRLNSIYGRTFSSQFKDDEQWKAALVEWSRRLKDIDETIANSVIDSLSIAEGEFPPNLIKFHHLCMIYGQPSWQETMKMALRDDVSHPVTAECRKRIGSWLLKNGSAAEVEKSWKEAWYAVIEELKIKKLENKS